MNCLHCGADLPSDSAFCHKCGESIRENEAGPASDGSEAGSANPKTAASRGELSDPKAPHSMDSVFRHSNVRDDPERNLWSGGYSAKTMVGTWLAAGLFTLFTLIGAVTFLAAYPYAWLVVAVVLLIVWSWLFLLLAYRKLNVKYELTNQRFVHQTGILRRVTDRIETIDMDDVGYEQGVIERLLNVGTIRISSSDRTHPELLMRGIDKVAHVAGLLDDARRKERLRRGLHIESI